MKFLSWSACCGRDDVRIMRRGRVSPQPDTGDNNRTPPHRRSMQVELAALRRLRISCCPGLANRQAAGRGAYGRPSRALAAARQPSAGGPADVLHARIQGSCPGGTGSSRAAPTTDRQLRPAVKLYTLEREVHWVLAAGELENLSGAAPASELNNQHTTPVHITLSCEKQLPGPQIYTRSHCCIHCRSLFLGFWLLTTTDSSFHSCLRLASRVILAAFAQMQGRTQCARDGLQN